MRRYGAGVVVMAFDEQGQAETAERKVAICERAYRLLVEQVGFPPEDLIFDPNVLAVATGIEEHRGFAKAFLEALPLIKERCPGARTSGGISNLSFAFRGNDAVREAMHSAFLYHAIRAGLDMGIVNAGQLVVYEDIEPELLELVEDVIFDRRDDATERLVEYAGRVQRRGDAARGRPLVARGARREAARARARARHRRLHRGGHRGGAAARRPAARRDRGAADGRHAGGRRPLRRGEDVPAAGREERARDEARGRLPRAVHGGRAGRRAARRARAGKAVLATVKGDVHDIGKNIVGVVLGCNDYDGGRPRRDGPGRADPRRGDRGGGGHRRAVRADHAVARPDGRRRARDGAARDGPAAADRRRHDVAPAHRRADRAGVLAAGRARPRRLARRAASSPTCSIPSGACGSTSRTAPTRSGCATCTPRRSASRCCRSPRARENRQRVAFDDLPVPEFTGRRLVEPDLATLREYIDWQFFFHAWELKGKFPAILEQPAARELFDDAAAPARPDRRRAAARGARRLRLLAGVVRGRRRRSSTRATRFCFLRQQSDYGDSRPNRCLADYVAPAGDHLGAFAVTAGIGADELAAAFAAEHDDYHAIMVKALADRLAEAFAEYLHEVARRAWYETGPKLPPEQLLAERFRGIRPAFGYPACPDHSEKSKLFALLGAEEAGLALTETYAMTPAASVSGIYLAHPEARYFSVGRLGRDQVEDYAARKRVSPAEVERWLRPNLGYEPAER